MKKNIKLIAAALLLGTQTLVGSLQIPPDDAYINRLNDEEKNVYYAFRERFGGKGFRYNHRHKLTAFLQMLNEIKIFVRADPEREMVRGVICGILWNGPYVARNNKRLKELFGKSKSSINACFAELGYANILHPVVRLPELFPVFCTLPNTEMRQWTIVALNGGRDTGDGLGVPAVAPSVAPAGQGVGDDLLDIVEEPDFFFDWDN